MPILRHHKLDEGPCTALVIPLLIAWLNTGKAGVSSCGAVTSAVVRATSFVSAGFHLFTVAASAPGSLRGRGDSPRARTRGIRQITTGSNLPDTTSGGLRGRGRQKHRSFFFPVVSGRGCCVDTTGRVFRRPRSGRETSRRPKVRFVSIAEKQPLDEAWARPVRFSLRHGLLSVRAVVGGDHGRAVRLLGKNNAAGASLESPGAIPRRDHRPHGAMVGDPY